jgi:Fe-S-cluster-containing dehydrogenase component
VKARIVMDEHRCAGCRCCELACSLHHEGECNPSLSRIVVKMSPFDPEHYRPTLCRQCEDPACVEACQYDAITVDQDTGAKVLNVDMCVGCKLCMTACPYNSEMAMIRFDPKRTTCLKCDLCQGEPKCVEICPWGALTMRWGEEKE